MRTFRIPAMALLLLASLVFLGDAAASAKPDWVDGKSRKYPDLLYLTGVGSGDDRKSAEDAAYAAVSRIFQAEIDSRTRDWERYTQTDLRGKTKTTRDIQLEQITQVATKKVLEEVSIAEVWTDEHEKRSYALAVLDRDRQTAALTERIAALDRDVLEYRRSGEEAESPLDAVRALRRAVKGLIQREVYNTDLRIVSPLGRGIDPPESLGALQQRITDLLSHKIEIGVRVEGPYRDRIGSAITEGLTSEGFIIREGEEKSLDLLIRTTVTLERSETSEWKYVRWIVSVDLMRPEDGKVLGSFSSHGREGHLDFSGAEARAVRAIEKEAVEELSRRLVAVIYGETEG